MTTEVLSLALQPGVQATFGQGRVWYVKTANNPLTITAETAGSGAKVRKFINVLAGFKFTAADGDGWTYLRVISATAQTVEMVIGDDDVEVAGAVSIVGTVQVLGTVTANPTLSSGFTASQPDAGLANATAISVPANAARRAMTVGSLSTNTGSVRVQSVGAGANRGLELQPGQYVTLNNTGAFDVRNDSGATQTLWFLES